MNSYKQPGQVFVKGYGAVEVNSWDDDFLYDEISLTVASNAIAAGTEGVFFRDVQSKTLKQTNMSISSQLPSGWEMIVLKVMLHIQGTGSTAVRANVANILEYGYVQFLIDNSYIAIEGPATRFPCPYGANGHLDIAHTSAADVYQYNNGIPVASAVAPLRIPIILSDRNTFKGTIHFYDALSGLTDGTVKLQMILHGFKKMPAM